MGQLFFDASRLRALREANGWSLERAAELMGLEAHVLAGVEKGHRTLTKKQWVDVARAVAHSVRPRGVPASSGERQEVER